MVRQTIARVTVGLFVAALSTLIYTDFAFGQCELDSVNASDATPQDHFGASVAMDGDFVVIGAPGAERVGREFVPSYVFRRIGSTWVEDTILAPDDVSPRSQFGRSVAISGDVAVVGAIIDGHSEPFQFDGPGSAYVYRHDGGVWAEEVKLLASDTAMGNFFGNSVAISGGRIVVGASGYRRAGTNTGAAYVFEHDGTQWTERVKLIPTDSTGFDFFGRAVALDGTIAVVGAPNVGHSEPTSTDGSGAVYVFRYDGRKWSEEQKLTVESIPRHDWFGGAVSISNDLILVGALGDDVAGKDAGAAYVFHHEGGEWVYEARLIGNDTRSYHRFGGAVSVTGQLAVVGASNTQNGRGAAYVFQRNGTTWSQVAQLTASDTTFSQTWFGSSVAQNGDFVVVGASVADRVGTNTGSAYFYHILGGPDCNANDINDACEPDCNESNVPDDCDIAAGTSDDCNGNTIPDECELDCNENGVQDDCDIDTRTSDDCNGNTIPDECELDCNENGVQDDCDIDTRTSDDCNENGVPDDCEPDCNDNEVTDSCDIESEFSRDCNLNGVPDECEPDDDCNENDLQDICDIANGTSDDCNANNVPDECDIAEGRFFATEVAGLVGVYGGWIGPYVGASKYAFGQEFARVNNAWLRVAATAWGALGLYGCLDDSCVQDWYTVYSDPQTCLPLIPTDASLDGEGVVMLSVSPPCCDQQAWISDAILWFDAVPLPAPTNLRDFARFQACFGGKYVGPPEPCDPLDYDRDNEIDLDDYDIFRMAFTGPK